MKQAPCPRAVSIEKEQNQCKAIEQTQWPCLLPFFEAQSRTRQRGSHHPHPTLPWPPCSLAACYPFSHPPQARSD